MPADPGPRGENAPHDDLWCEGCDDPYCTPFVDIPSGVEIARWFIESGTCRKSNDAEGFWLWRDRESGAYSYVWIEAYVDDDMEAYWLLDVRTSGDEGESRDFLFVGSVVDQGAGETADQHRIEACWHQEPIAFGAGVDAHVVRGTDGLIWFAGQREAAIRARIERCNPPTNGSSGAGGG